MKAYKTFKSLEGAVEWWENEVSFASEFAHYIKYPEHQKLARRGLNAARKAYNVRLDHLDHVKEMNRDIKTKKVYAAKHNSDRARDVIKGMIQQIRVLKANCHKTMETHLLQCVDAGFDDFPFWVGIRIRKARADA